MEKFTTEQLKNALIEIQKMPTTPEIVSASVMTCNELEKRMGEDAFYDWFDKV